MALQGLFSLVPAKGAQRPKAVFPKHLVFDHVLHTQHSKSYLLCTLMGIIFKRNLHIEM